MIKLDVGLSDSGSVDQFASKFSAFFQDKVRLIQENLTFKAGLKHEPEDKPDAVDDKLSFFVPATKDEVRRLINKSPSKSCSFDPVTSWLLKEQLTCLLQTVTNTVNLSMSTGIVPTTMKTALVTPLLK